MRPSERMIGNSPALHAALEHLSRLAPIHRPVLVVGERGTGKELAAERLHYLSSRWEAPLVKVNCAAMTETLLESELFGHEAGAFTGATRMHRGHFEQAEGGTLFLDELGTTSTRLQEKLLRLIEYGEFQRVGGHKTLQVDVRVIAATNADLRALARTGQFREDLLDRLSFDVVHLPALRDRPDDIEELAEHFAMQMCAELGRALFPGFSRRAREELLLHTWPGNVRELKNVIERSVFRWQSPDAPLDAIVIDPFLSPFAHREASPDTSADTRPVEQLTAGDIFADTTPHACRRSFHDTVQALEIQLLRNALAENGHNQRRTAESLGLTYHQMRGLVRKYALTTP